MSATSVTQSLRRACMRTSRSSCIHVCGKRYAITNPWPCEGRIGYFWPGLVVVQVDANDEPGGPQETDLSRGPHPWIAWHVAFHSAVSGFTSALHAPLTCLPSSEVHATLSRIALETFAGLPRCGVLIAVAVQSQGQKKSRRIALRREATPVRRWHAARLTFKRTRNRRIA